MNSEINETIGQSSYKELVEAIGKALSEGRDKAIQTVNATLIKTNWQIGHYIVEYEQKGKERAEYPVRPRTAQRRLIQRIVFRSGSASGKALADGAILH